MIRASLLGLWLLSACAEGVPGLDLALDAGPDAGARAETCDDAGVCVPNETLEAACGELVDACCGETCQESPACAAAQLLQTYEPFRCADALLDTQTFPRCALGNCDSLVLKVCGPADQCPDAPGCAAAKELQARGADPNATQEQLQAASSSCLQALEDEVVFASCTG